MSHTQIDEDIIAAAKRGEAKAQKQIYELHAPAMMSVCYRYVNNVETAKDLLHDGFIKMFTKIDMYSGIGSFAGWMRRVFVTTCLEYLRQKNTVRFSDFMEEYDNQINDTEISVVDKISADELLELIADLPTGYRTVFNLFAVEGYSHAEIAGILGISEVTSRTQFMRARKILQQAILKNRT